ncbi:MAG TPA: hypothetical protein VK699_13265 [Terriglobales bacterium]|nr:hypothetical protein [Terriglobales bacterium]
MNGQKNDFGMTTGVAQPASHIDPARFSDRNIEDYEFGLMPVVVAQNISSIVYRDDCINVFPEQ